MKTSENQASTSKEHESIDAQAAHSSSGEQQFKKPHPKLFNHLMKPSLSLTSLPPQSPKEVSDEAQSVERPYNSLKVSAWQIYEFWLIYFNFRKNAMARRNFGDVRGNRKHRSAQRLRTREPVAEKMELISGPPIISSWTQIWLIRVGKRPGRQTREEMTS